MTYLRLTVFPVKTLLLWPFLSFILAGCSATGPIFQSVAEVPEGKATVYVYRPFEYFNAGGWPEIFIDGTKAFALKNKGYGVVYLHPGEHVVKAEGSMLFTNWYPRPAQLTHTFEANHEYYVRVTPTHTATYIVGNTVAATGAASVLIVPKEFARPEIEQTHKVE